MLGQGDDKESANVTNTRMWVEGAVFEYEPHCITNNPGKILTTYPHTGGGAQMPIRRKILRWKQFERDVRGGTMQRRVLMCWMKTG